MLCWSVASIASYVVANKKNLLCAYKGVIQTELVDSAKDPK